MARDYWGKQEYPTGWLTRGRIKRGEAPAQSRFRAPNAGVSPSLSGGRSPIVPTLGIGDIVRGVSNMYVNIQEQNERDAYRANRQQQQQQAQARQQQQQKRRAGIQYAKAKSRVNKRNAAAATQAQAQANQPHPLMPPATPVAPVNPYAPAWANSPNNPANPWRPPTGSPASSRTAPGIPFGQNLPAPSGPAPRKTPPIPAAFAPPPPPPPSAPSWGTPDPNFNHGITPAHLIPPAPGTKAWHKQQAQDAKQQAQLQKQKQASMPPPPPTVSPYGPPTVLNPPTPPSAAAPAGTRTNKRGGAKATPAAKTTPAKKTPAKKAPAVSAPQVVGALAPVENLTQTTPTEASPAPALTPAVAPPKGRKTTPKSVEQPASKPATTRNTTRKTTSTPAPAPVTPAPAPVAPAATPASAPAPKPERKLMRNANGELAPHTLVDGKWTSEW
jgi:hypothetical protein